MKIVICIPTRDRPTQACLDSLEGSAPLLTAAGIDHSVAIEIGCPYISGARATMLGKALRAGADQVIFIDDDVSWNPGDLLRLVQAEDDVVGGTYRFKTEGDPHYMGKVFLGDSKRPLVRDDGFIKAICLPAGFLKVTRKAVYAFMGAFPELVIDADGFRNVDLFNHGAHKGVWYGEDYAFCRRWLELGGDIWLIPDLDLDHNGHDQVYRGNYHEWLLGLARESAT